MDNDRLRDILEMDIVGETASQRRESFLAQVGDSYRFRVGKTPVRISFDPSGGPLEKKLRAYFLGLKG